MPQIGQFTREESRIIGRIETFTLFHDIVIVPADPSDAENAPDYRVHDHDPGARDIGPEIGAGWNRTGEKAGEYIALVIDDPGLAQPIRANPGLRSPRSCLASGKRRQKSLASLRSHLPDA